MTGHDDSAIPPDATGASNADAAPADGVERRDRDPGAAPWRKADALAPGEKPDQLQHDAETRTEGLVDEGVEETFPASDPATGKHIT
jgi:hypothetical protein